MDTGAWRAAVHRAARSPTRLSDFHFPLLMQETLELRFRSLVWEDPLMKEMAPHSSILAWRIPWTLEPGGLQPMGSQGVGYD